MMTRTAPASLAHYSQYHESPLPMRFAMLPAAARGRVPENLPCVCVTPASTIASFVSPPQIPTMRFDPVHINCDEYCSFPVADRSPALVEWMKTDDAKQCTHILLVGAARRRDTLSPLAARAAAR